MKEKLQIGLRILFGLFCFIMGINKFVNFLPMPSIPGDGGTLMGIYVSSGFLSFIGVIEMVSGIALVANKFVPIALTFLTAVMLNAFVFHLLHDIAGIGGAVFGFSLSLILIFLNKDRFGKFMNA